jgi:hypothetical protein
MKNVAILVLFLMLCGCEATDKTSCSVDPDIFCKPFEQLSADLSPEDKTRLLEATPRDIIMMHHGFGTGIRNRFDLWGENDLTQFFNDNGVQHPDGMSAPFITGFIGYLQGRRVVMTEEIKKVPPPPPPPPPPYDHPSEQA